MRKPTIRDIAEECGLSFSAVSKALRGSSEVSEKTRARVAATAERLGYTENTAARMLRTKSSRSIGVIFEDVTGSGLQHQHFARIFDAMNVTANENSYDLIFLNGAGRGYCADAQSRGCDGIVVCTALRDRNETRKFLDKKVPVVALDCVIEGAPTVVSDNGRGFSALIGYILSKGHKKIAYVHGEDSFVTRSRTEAFRAAMSAAGLSVPREYMVRARYHDPALSGEATERLLSLPAADVPTCIIYPDDFSSLGGIPVFEKKGVVPGRDISVAGYDGIFFTSFMSPPLTTYEQNADGLGRGLIQLLLKVMPSAPDSCFEKVEVCGRLVPGASVAALR